MPLAAVACLPCVALLRNDCSLYANIKLSIQPSQLTIHLRGRHSRLLRSLYLSRSYYAEAISTDIGNWTTDHFRKISMRTFQDIGESNSTDLTGSAPCSSSYPNQRKKLSGRRPRVSKMAQTVCSSTWAVLLVTVVCGLLSVAEGAKVQLIPRPRKAMATNVAIETENKLTATAPVQEPMQTLTLPESSSSLKQLSSGADSGAQLTVPLQAVLVRNEQGENVLQLSIESSKALQEALDPLETQATLPGEVPPTTLTLVDTKTMVAADVSEVSTPLLRLVGLIITFFVWS